MIILRRNEKIKRRYPAKTKKDGAGKGTLYFTNTRVVFESDKHGFCFECGYQYLYNWTRKKKSIVLRWHEPMRKGEEWDWGCPEYSAEFEIADTKFNGGKLLVWEVSKSLFFRMITFHKESYGKVWASGFYSDKDNSLYSWWQDTEKEQRKPIFEVAKDNLYEDGKYVIQNSKVLKIFDEIHAEEAMYVYNSVYQRHREDSKYEYNENVRDCPAELLETMVKDKNKRVAFVLTEIGGLFAERIIKSDRMRNTNNLEKIMHFKPQVDSLTGKEIPYTEYGLLEHDMMSHGLYMDWILRKNYLDFKNQLIDTKHIKDNSEVKEPEYFLKDIEHDEKHDTIESWERSLRDYNNGDPKTLEWYAKPITANGETIFNGGKIPEYVKFEKERIPVTKRGYELKKEWVKKYSIKTQFEYLKVIQTISQQLLYRFFVEGKDVVNYTPPIPDEIVTEPQEIEITIETLEGRITEAA